MRRMSNVKVEEKINGKINGIAPLQSEWNFYLTQSRRKIFTCERMCEFIVGWQKIDYDLLLEFEQFITLRR